MYCQISPCRDDGYKGTPVIVFGGVVGSNNPVVERIDVKGELIEGAEVVACGCLAGGAVCDALYAWQRSNSSGPMDEYEEEVEGDRWETVSSSASYKIGTADINKCLRVVYTPLRPDGSQGDAAWYLCDGKVTARAPTVVDVSIVSSDDVMMPGVVLTGVGRWTGPGTEGSSLYSWCRVGTDVILGTNKSYTVVADDVGYRLCFTYSK